MKHSHEVTYVFVAYGSFGDIYPLLAVASTLQADGHRAVFVANEYFADAVRRAGIEYVQAGTREEQLAARETADSNGDTFEGAMTRYDYLIGRNYERVGRFLEDLLRRGERPFVVTHGRLSPAFPMCERHGIPMVLTYYAPAQIPDNREDYVLYLSSFGAKEWIARHVRWPFHRIKRRIHKTPMKHYNAWRKQAGYPRVPHPLWAMLQSLFESGGFAWALRHPNVVREIALVPEWFADPIGDDIRHIEFTGFVFHRDEHPANNRQVEEFVAAHGAPIVFTPGTAVEDARAFCGAIAGTCKLLDAPAIVLSRYVATSLAEFDFAAAGARVLALDHVDLGDLLPKAKLLVHHGGVGTLAQAVRAGIPQIVRPRMYDQPNNGLRVVLNGVGGMLYDEGYTPEEIASVYAHLTSSELHRQHLAYYSELTRSQSGERNAAQAIVAAAQEHAPRTVNVRLPAERLVNQPS